MGSRPAPEPARDPGPRRFPVRFAGTSLAPTSARHSLRAALEPGESVFGWAIAQYEPGARRAALSLSLMFIPVIGQLLASMDIVASLKRQRLVVLTDRRLLLIHPDRRAAAPDGSGIAAEYGLGDFSIEDRDAGATWWVHDDEHPPAADDGDPSQASAPSDEDGTREIRRQTRRKPGQKKARGRAGGGVARLRLIAEPDEPWTMRIHLRPGDASGRLVEALRTFAERPSPAGRRPPGSGPPLPGATGHTRGRATGRHPPGMLG